MSFMSIMFYKVVILYFAKSQNNNASTLIALTAKIFPILVRFIIIIS